MAEIIVLGAGVIGLQTALTLLESGYGVTVIAKHWPGDDSINYTSPKAGAHWRSALDDSLSKETFIHWQSLLRNGEAEDAGLAITPVTSIWDLPTAETANDCADIWWSELAPDFTILTRDDAQWFPHGAHFAVRYKSFCINPNTYLAYLLSKVRRLGGRTQVAKVESLQEVFGYVPAAVGVVNCTGLGAISLVSYDPGEAEKLYPTRGQTALVKGEAKEGRIRLGDGYLAYVIRRPGEGTILGGCRLDGDWSVEVDKGMSEEILKNCKPLAPELLVDGEFQVISEQVGRRPSRKGGPRIEIERILHDGNVKFICHHYGHSGDGYQSSIGSARVALGLIRAELDK